jgi:formylglycine-generating enzyme
MSHSPQPPEDTPTSPQPEQTPPLFVGREALFDWVTEHLAQPAPTPLLLIGPPQMGKTAVLHQIRSGCLGPDILPVYIDFAQLLYGSHSIFLHDLTQTAVGQLQPQGVTLPEPKKPAFVINPYKAFQEQFLQPILDQLNGRKLLLLGDNLNALLEQIASEAFTTNAFETLYQFLHKSEKVYSLFTLSQPGGEGQRMDLAPFANLPQWELGPLTLEEVTLYLRQPTEITTVKDVIGHIYQLSGGRPADLQRILQAVGDWQAFYQIRRLTVADVAAASHAVGITPAANHPPAAFTITPPAPPERADYRSPYRTAPLSRGVLLMGSALLLLALAIIASALLSTDTQAGSADDTPSPSVAETAVRLTSEALAAAIIAQTPSATPTSPPTATATPSQTPNPTDTPAPPTETPQPTLSPTPDSLPESRIRELDAMPMLLVPGGSFMMGARDDDLFAASDERPLHPVTLAPFYIDQYEVNVAQYAAFLNRLGTYRQACNGFDCAMPRTRVGVTSFLLEEETGSNLVLYSALTGFSNFPANYISWHGANAYCAAMGARLPTEAEWEFAARGDDGRTYPWGNEAPTDIRAIFNSSFENLRPVNALSAGRSPFGAYGMAGSMWEWVADWYDEEYYSVSPEFNPTGPERGIARVMRGGAWPLNNEAERIRSANRSSSTPEVTSASIGFRCAQDP